MSEATQPTPLDVIQTKPIEVMEGLNQPTKEDLQQP
jgi:hypothetical protein